MKSISFRRKAFLLAGTLSAMCVLGGVFYARALTRMQVVDCAQTFWFLVSEEENVAAAAQSVSLHGGAGYVMRRKGEEYAVLACYFSQSAARAVGDNLEAKNLAVSVREESGGTLYLKKNSEKRSAEGLRGCFDTLSSCIRLLYDLSAAADTGGYTQQELRRLLADVGGVLSRLAEENRDGVFTDISACASAASAEIMRLRQDVVYARDIRYIQVWLSDSYLRLADEFSL